MNYKRNSLFAVGFVVLTIVWVGCEKDASKAKSVAVYKTTNEPPASPNSTCPKCGHLFLRVTGKSVDVVDPYNWVEANRHREDTYCKACAPAWDRANVLTHSHYIRQPEWLACDENGKPIQAPISMKETTNAIFIQCITFTNIY